MLYGIVLLASIINMFHTMFMYKTKYSKLNEVNSFRQDEPDLFKVEQTKNRYVHKSAVYKPTAVMYVNSPL